jgi:hypothetical protein
VSEDQAARIRKLETDHQDAVALQLGIQGEQIALRKMVYSSLGSLSNDLGSVEKQVANVKEHVNDVRQQVAALVKRFDDNQLADNLDRDRQRAENEGRLGRMEGKVTILIQSILTLVLIVALVGIVFIGYLFLRPFL